MKATLNPDRTIGQIAESSIVPFVVVERLSREAFAVRESASEQAVQTVDPDKSLSGWFFLRSDLKITE